MLKTSTYLLTAVLVIASILLQYCKVDNMNTEMEETPALPKAVPELIWQDEFDQNGPPDAAKWSFDVRPACSEPAGSDRNKNVLQSYTRDRPENARVVDGFLILEAHKENWDKCGYSSARLVSKGKRDILYGRIEIRAKLPSGTGTLPALRMQASDDKYGSWPKSGGIDIMEHHGSNPDTIFGIAYTESMNDTHGTGVSGRVYIPDAEESFHEYVLEWEPDVLRWYVDDQLYHSFEKTDENPENWPYDQPFHIAVDLAVGSMKGVSGNTSASVWPQKMLVDYVRIYKL